MSSFCNYISNALVKIWEFTYTFLSTKWYVIAFLLFLHFPQSGTHSFSVHFINIITHSASPPSSPSPSLNHKANLTHHLATIHSNNPVPPLSAILAIKGASGIQWVREFCEDWRFIDLSRLSRIMDRDKSLIPYHSDSENRHVTSSSLWRRY